MNRERCRAHVGICGAEFGGRPDDLRPERQGLRHSSDSFTNCASSVAAGKNTNVLIPDRYSSLKMLFSIFQLSTDIGNADAKTISARASPITDDRQWYYSIGGKNVPSTPVKSNTEAYAELSKAIHAIGAVDHTYMIQRAD